jgi:tetratricopeptide (TPR) repeat protein
MTPRGRGASLFVTLLLVSACKSRAPLEASSGALLLTAESPPSQAALPTNDGKLAVRAFRGQIELERKLSGEAMHRKDGGHSLVRLLQTSAQFFGTLEDYDRALELADDLARQDPADPAAHLLRASALASFHRFDEALAEVAEGQRKGADSERADAQRAAIWQAEGLYDQSLPLYEKLLAHGPDAMTVGAAAGSFAEVSDSRASDLFVRAESSYRDVSPFPVAWLEFQQGLRWEREGQTSRAMAFYRDAVARLPGYAPATGHLAALEAATGALQPGIQRLRELVARSDDPEYVGQLSSLLAQAGEAAEAARFKATAAERFDGLIARHPAAFADHAARFWLSAGGEPQRALALAHINLKGRATLDAFDLALTAALTAGEKGDACDLAQQAASLTRATPHLRFLIERARAGCAATGGSR